MTDTTHDPLCDRFGVPDLPPDYEGHDAGLRAMLPVCTCDLIARVVERERRLARERVLALLALHGSECCESALDDAADAAGGVE